MTDNFYSLLSDKLLAAGIPNETVKKYIRLYKSGVFNEIQFDNDELPGDDHFVALKYVCGFLGTDNVNEILIKRYLGFSYENICVCREKIKELFPKCSKNLEKLYRKDASIFGVTPYDIEYTYSLITDYVKDEETIWEVFSYAIILGMYITECRFDALVDAIGLDAAAKFIGENSLFLLYPNYADPEVAITFLKDKNFNQDTISKILFESPDFLLLFRDCTMLKDQIEKNNRRIDEIVKKYGGKA